VKDFLERLDPELAQVLDAVPAMDLSGDLPTLREALRRANAPLLAKMPEVPDVDATDTRAGDVPVRVYSRRDRVAPTAALLWVHGGGMVFGSVDGDDFRINRWVEETNCVVVSVEYRLAPEHQYPAHVEDCFAALQWLTTALEKLGIDQSRMIYERESRNTVENVRYSKALVQPKPGEAWLLVTSGWHMPRSVGIFRQQGCPVIPYPVDYLTDGVYWKIKDPDFNEGLGLLHRGLKEWIGMVAYHLLGYTDSWFPGPR